MSKKKQYNSKGIFFTSRLTTAMNVFLNHPLTLVEAPMGYGKTLFVRESLKKTEAVILWQKVFNESIADFWGGFCRQLSQVDQEKASRLEAIGFPSDNSTLYEVLGLIESMDFQKNTVLVMDDYHAVACTETNRFIEQLVTNEISCFNMVVIGRYSGFENIEEIKLKGYLLHIKKEAFQFSAEDIRAYYQICGIRLSDVKALELYALTEGWISALYLIMLDYLENDSLGVSKDIGKLIKNAIYVHFTEEVKHLLLSLCLFNGFTLKQAIFMSQNQEAESLLEEVIAKNAFVTYDSTNKIYQIHVILGNFLQEELEKTSMQMDLYKQSGKWFLQTGELNLAFHYFYLCGDFDAIYRALEKQKNYAYNKALIIKCYLDCPDSVMEKHLFGLLVLAFELYTYNELELFSAICEKFQVLIHNKENLPTEERNQLLGEFELLMSFTKYNDIRKMSIHFKKAAELLQRPSHLLPQNGIWTFGSPSVLYMFYRESGMLDDALEALFEVLPLYSTATDGNANAGEYCMMAEQYLYRGDFENALITSYQALHRAASKDQVSNTLCARFILVRIALMKGDFTEAVEQYHKIRKEIETAKEYVLLHTLEICQGYVYALLGKPHKIPLWLLEGDYSSDKLLYPNHAMLNIVHGRALLIKGEYHKLIGSMEDFMGTASAFPNLLGQIHTLIYVAAAYHGLLRQNDALAVMKQALDLAMPDHVYLPFVENCDHIKPLLSELKSRERYSLAIDQILKLYVPYQKGMLAIDRKYFSDDKPQLTDREMEISLLVAQGLSNKEIAEKLYITVNTVKMALKGIYVKLSINSRMLIKQALESM